MISKKYNFLKKKKIPDENMSQKITNPNMLQEKHKSLKMLKNK